MQQITRQAPLHRWPRHTFATDLLLARVPILKVSPGIEVVEIGHRLARFKGRIVIGSDEDELQDEKPRTATKKAPVGKGTAAAPPKCDETPVAAASA